MVAVLQISFQQKSVSLEKFVIIQKPEEFKKPENILIFSGFFFYDDKILNLIKCWIICKVYKVFSGKKIIGLKFKRRKNYRRHFGHRSLLVKLQVIAFIDKL